MTTRGTIEAIAAAVPAPAEQLELMAPVRGFGACEEARAGEVRELVARHRAGRPPGAQNLATREVKAFIRRMFGDPLVEGFRWAMHTPESLALVLGCTRLEAFDRLEALRKDLTRYMHAPQAPEDQDGQAVPTFHVTIGQRASSGAVLPPWIEASEAKSLELQDNAQGGDRMSHAAQSHGEAK